MKSLLTTLGNLLYVIPFYRPDFMFGERITFEVYQREHTTFSEIRQYVIDEGYSGLSFLFMFFMCSFVYCIIKPRLARFHRLHPEEFI